MHNLWQVHRCIEYQPESSGVLYVQLNGERPGRGQETLGQRTRTLLPGQQEMIARPGRLTGTVVGQQRGVVVQIRRGRRGVSRITKTSRVYYEIYHDLTGTG